MADDETQTVVRGRSHLPSAGFPNPDYAQADLFERYLAKAFSRSLFDAGQAPAIGMVGISGSLVRQPDQIYEFRELAEAESAVRNAAAHSQRSAMSLISDQLSHALEPSQNGEAEWEWLQAHREMLTSLYAGSWIAIVGHTVVATGANELDVLVAAERQGYSSSLTHHVDTQDDPIPVV